MIIEVNKGIDLNTIDTSRLLKEAEESLKKYLEIVLMDEQSPVFKNYCVDMKTLIYEESPYTDIWDFVYDFHRYRMGLPIFIDFKLV